MASEKTAYLYAHEITGHSLRVLELLDDLVTYQKIETLVVAQQLLALEERRAVAQAARDDRAVKVE